jgi:hypothetical protein
MSSMERGQLPRSCALRSCMFAASSVAALVGGCAHEGQNTYSQNGWYAGGPRQQAAAVPVPIEMEDDGKPAQLPPPLRAQAEQDDPREPWSPNYGGQNASGRLRPTSPGRKIADAASE